MGVRFKMITLTVNGELLTAPDPMTIVAFLEHRGIQTAAIAVAHNGNVLLRSEYASVVLQDGDRLEIVRMVGGG